MPVQSTYHSNTLPPWLDALYRDIGERSKAVRDEQYQPYQQNRLSPLMNPDLNQAYNMGRQTEDYLPYLQQGQQLAQQGSASFPQNVDQYMDPYQRQVIQAMRQESADAFNQDFLPSMERQFVASGQHGSTRHQDLVRKGAFDAQKALGQNVGRSLSEGYGQAGKLFNADMARKLEAAGQMPGLGQAKQAGRLGDIEALTNQGGAQRAHNQAGLDIDYQNFMRQKAYPQEALASQAAIMGNIPAPQSSYTAQQTPGIPQLNTAGNLGALAGNLYGARMAYGRKAGGSIKKKEGLSRLPLTQGTFTRKPKPGGSLGVKRLKNRDMEMK